MEETDKVGRPYFIYLRAIIEDVLSSELQKGQLQSLKGVIHTPMPATPFCTEGKISKDLMVTTIEKDLLRLGTVLCRSVIAREYLEKGGKLDIVYPKYGKPRTPEQLKIYQETLKKYAPDLKDHPLDCISIHKDLVGAYDIFENLKGKKFAFAIRASQANSVSERNIFGLCFNLKKKAFLAYGLVSLIIILFMNGFQRLRNSLKSMISLFFINIRLIIMKNLDNLKVFGFIGMIN